MIQISRQIQSSEQNKGYIKPNKITADLNGISEY